MFELDEIPEFDRTVLAIDDPFRCLFVDHPAVLEAKIEEFFGPMLGGSYRVRVYGPNDGGFQGQKIDKVWLDEAGSVPYMGPSIHVSPTLQGEETIEKLKKSPQKSEPPKKLTLQPFTADAFVDVVKQAANKVKKSIAKDTGLDVTFEPYEWLEGEGFPTMGFKVESKRTKVPHYIVLDPYAVCYVSLVRGLDFKLGAVEKAVQIRAAVREWAAKMFTEVFLSYPKPKGS